MVYYKEYMETYGTSDANWKNFLAEVKTNGRPVILYGQAGQYAIKVYNAMLEEKVEVVAVCNEEGWETLYGLPVYSQEQAEREWPDAVYCFPVPANGRIAQDMEQCAEKLCLKGYQLDKDVFTFFQMYDVFEDTGLRNVLLRSDEIVLLGNRKLCTALGRVLSRAWAYTGNILILDPDEKMEGAAESVKRNAVWFYIDLPESRGRLGYIKKKFPLFGQDKKIYLSDYYNSNLYMLYLAGEKYPEGLEEERKILSVAKEMESLLTKQRHNPIGAAQCQKIMFWMSTQNILVETMWRLFEEYRKHGAVCVVLFPELYSVFSAGAISNGTRGSLNAERMLTDMRKFVEAGGECYFQNDLWRYRDDYDICYFTSGYSNGNEFYLRGMAEKIVGIQSTAIYTHCYDKNGEFERIFNEKHDIDYVVASDFTADWVKRHKEDYEKKIIRLGYPKLDILYRKMNSAVIVPEQWQQKCQGKTVFLCAVIHWEIYEMLVKMAKENPDIVMILRPHPIHLEDWSMRRSLEAFGEEDNIILDNLSSYMAAFYISDAMITTSGQSVFMNYLYTGKPVCWVDNHMFQYLDYTEDDWYKAMYVLESADGIKDFVEMVKKGEDHEKDSKEKYRKRITRHFDGKVCARIVEYFAKNQ